MTRPGRASWTTVAAEEERYRPLYARALGLRFVNPGGVLCFVFFEGAVSLAALLALAELVTWWAVLVLPAAVAAMVKLNDMVAEMVVRTAALVPEQERDRFRRQMEPAVGRAPVWAPGAVDRGGAAVGAVGHAGALAAARGAPEPGLIGRSASEQGVIGRSASARGVTGRTAFEQGVIGRSDSGRGVIGRSASGRGAVGGSAPDRGAVGRALSDRGVAGRGAVGVAGPRDDERDAPISPPRSASRVVRRAFPGVLVDPRPDSEPDARP